MTSAKYAILHYGRFLGEYATRKEADREMSEAVRAWRYYGTLGNKRYPGGTINSRYTAMRDTDPNRTRPALRSYRLRCNNKPAGYLILDRLP